MKLVKLVAVATMLTASCTLLHGANKKKEAADKIYKQTEQTKITNKKTYHGAIKVDACNLACYADLLSDEGRKRILDRERLQFLQWDMNSEPQENSITASPSRTPPKK